MNIRVAAICDFAQVRQGLLSIVSAGVTRIARPQFPAEMGVMLALTIETTDFQNPQEVRIRVEGADGQFLQETSAGFQVHGQGGRDPGEPALVSMAVDLRGVSLPREGRYQIVVRPMHSEEDSVILGLRAEYPSQSPGELSL